MIWFKQRERHGWYRQEGEIHGVQERRATHYGSGTKPLKNSSVRFKEEEEHGFVEVFVLNKLLLEKDKDKQMLFFSVAFFGLLVLRGEG